MVVPSPTRQTDVIRPDEAALSLYPTLWRGLRAAWIPEIGVSGTTLFDHSFTRNHGAFQNMDITDWIMGRGGWALNYTKATSDHVILLVESELDIIGPLSILVVFHLVWPRYVGCRHQS